MEAFMDKSKWFLAGMAALLLSSGLVLTGCEPDPVANDAAVPVINAQPQDASYTAGDTATPLSVSATVDDGGMLSYQWYTNTANGSTGGTPINGATNSSYTPPTADSETVYYYVVVTNTNNNATGAKTAAITSSVATITVTDPTNAAAPTISAHPQNASYTTVGTTTPLSVSASVDDEGTLSYQWYTNTANDNIGGTPISGATQESYTPPTASSGRVHYYVVVTNTNNSATGTKTAAVTSNVATITVTDPINAAEPVISVQPLGATYTTDVTATPLSVSATVADRGTLTYRWYSNAANSNTGGTPISGAIWASYRPPVTVSGRLYYYVVVTNTNTSATGARTAAVTSNAVAIIVTGGGGTNAGERSLRTLNGVIVPFRYVPAGSFQRDNTTTNITVITRGYWMGETEVTQELFQAVMGTNPSNFYGDADSGETQNRRPVERVSWYDAIAFCNKLSLANGKEPVYRVTGVDWENLAYSNIPTRASDSAWDAAVMDMSKDGYRLPTEMEWMWAAMGADTTSQPNTTGWSKAFAGSTGNYSVDDYAWYEGNAGGKTHQVGMKTANELGIRDMSGNVAELCWDWFGTIGTGTLTDPTGAAPNRYSVCRGGNWEVDVSSCAVANRTGGTAYYRYNFLGFRVVCP
jgi:formylglycine-generating enzyme required for sulfatase activity/quinol monooxygenase YgiN